MPSVPSVPDALQRALLWVAAGLGIVAVVVVGAWILDEKVIHDGLVSRNVTLAGAAVGGFGPADLEARLAAMAADVADDTLTIDLPQRVIQAANAEVGVALDVTGVRNQVMAAGRSGALVDQFR
ncbi:MAG: hypothetical protein M3349_09335, partial [Actinomycetota bacterium]|nr:hypothetical protein [Actinomycetota bacterium]